MMAEVSSLSGARGKALKVQLQPVGSWYDRYQPESPTRTYSQEVFTECAENLMLAYWAKLERSLHDKPTKFFAIDDDLKNPTEHCLLSNRHLMFKFFSTLWSEAAPWEITSVVSTIYTEYLTAAEPYSNSNGP